MTMQWVIDILIVVSLALIAIGFFPSCITGIVAPAPADKAARQALTQRSRLVSPGAASGSGLFATLPASSPPAVVRRLDARRDAGVPGWALSDSFAPVAPYGAAKTVLRERLRPGRQV